MVTLFSYSTDSFVDSPLPVIAVGYSPGPADSHPARWVCAARWVRTAQGWLNYQGFRRLQKTLAHPALRKLNLRHGRLAYKYLMPSLAAGLSRAERLAVMLHHYESILHHLRPAFFDWVLQERGIWQAQHGGQQFSITLAYPFESDFEGELSVVFRVGTTPVYTISFTLAPGRVLHSAAPTVAAGEPGAGHQKTLTSSSKPLKACTIAPRPPC